MTTIPVRIAARISPSPPLDQALRKEGVTASEIASVMGLSKWEDAFTVFVKKVEGLEESFQGPDVGPRRWGRVQEAELLVAYMEITGRKIIRPGTLQHPDRPWQIATPDGLVDEDPARGVECKTAGIRFAYLWGDPEEPNESDKIPTEYFLQCQYGMSVTDVEWWDVPALIGGNDFRLYTLRRDREIEEMMLEAAREFIEKHLKPRVPPPPGWTARSTEHVKKKFPYSGDGMMRAEREHLPQVERLYVLNHISEAVEQEQEATKNRLKVIIGEKEGLEGPDWRIHWRRSKDIEKTDWKAVAQEYRNQLELDAVEIDESDRAETIRRLDETVQRFTETKPGFRSFRPNLPDEVFWLAQGKKVFKALTAFRPLVSGKETTK